MVHFQRIQDVHHQQKTHPNPIRPRARTTEWILGVLRPHQHIITPRILLVLWFFNTHSISYLDVLNSVKI